jgi:hypothetical protein
VPREFLGQARDLRRRIESDAAAYFATLDKLIAPVAARLRKHPKRNLRSEMLTALVQGWMAMEAYGFRIDINARLERTRAFIVERISVAGKMRLLAWDGDSEPGIGVTEIIASADGARFRLTSRMLCVFSLHSIARRYQRSLDCTDIDVLTDMDVAAQVDLTGLDPGGFKIVTNTQGGGWRGRSIHVENANESGGQQSILSIRTWVKGRT